MPDYNLEDIALMIGACVAIWGDGTLSSRERELLLEFIKQYEPEVFDRGWVDHRDTRDLELCRIEYLVWLLEHINGMKYAMLSEHQDERRAQEMAIVQLCDMYRDKITSQVRDMSPSGTKEAIPYIQAKKRSLFNFMEKVSQADSEANEVEVALILKVKRELSAPWEKLSIQFSLLNKKGKVLFCILIISMIYAPTCWLPWHLEGCRTRNGQSLALLNKTGLIAVSCACLLSYFNPWLCLFTWIPVKIPGTKKQLKLKPLS